MDSSETNNSLSLCPPESKIFQGLFEYSSGEITQLEMVRNILFPNYAICTKLKTFPRAFL